MKYQKHNTIILTKDDLKEIIKAHFKDKLPSEFCIRFAITDPKENIDRSILIEYDTEENY